MMTERPKTVPCWWCGNPDTRLDHGMVPVGDRQPPGCCVRCHGPPDEVCGTASPYVWRNGGDIQAARDEAVRLHNAGPRQVDFLGGLAAVARGLKGTKEDDEIVHAYVMSRKKVKLRGST